MVLLSFVFMATCPPLSLRLHAQGVAWHGLVRIADSRPIFYNVPNLPPLFLAALFHFYLIIFHFSCQRKFYFLKNYCLHLPFVV